MIIKEFEIMNVYGKMGKRVINEFEGGKTSKSESSEPDKKDSTSIGAFKDLIKTPD